MLMLKKIHYYGNTPTNSQSLSYFTTYGQSIHLGIKHLTHYQDKHQVFYMRVDIKTPMRRFYLCL